MCLIAYAPKKSLIVPNSLRNAHINNGDGWGIVFAQDNKLHYCKRMSSFETFKRVFELVPKEAPVAVHFRFRTHGEKSHDNLHPFEILSLQLGDQMDLALMHNGVISGTGIWKSNDPRSDTAVYVDEILKPIIKEKPDIIFNTGFKRLVERDVGKHNKLLFILGDSRVIIFNEKEGHTNEKEAPGVWYSNRYSLDTPHYRSNRASSFIGDQWKNQHHNIHNNAGEPSKSTVVDLSNHGNPHATSIDSRGYATTINSLYPPEIDITDEIKGQLKEGEYLIAKRTQGGPNWGYGWIRDTNKDTMRFDMVVGLMQRKMVESRFEESQQRDALKIISNHLAQQDLLELKTKSQVTVESKEKDSLESSSMSAFVKEKERILDTKDFALMNKSEVLDWVLTYPDEAAAWLYNNGVFGGKQAIYDWLQNNFDQASEYMYNRSHYNDKKTITIGNKPFDDGSDEAMWSIYA